MKKRRFHFDEYDFYMYMHEAGHLLTICTVSLVVGEFQRYVFDYISFTTLVWHERYFDNCFFC